MFDSVDPKMSLPELEQKVLELWRREKTFEQVQAARANGEPFVFFEGPPTANAAPGFHHVEARAFKDVIPRFQTMLGKRVDRKAGWDTHGLPVELQVEKKLGLKNKKEIEAYGIAKFNAECKKDVWAFKEGWEKLTERIGFWLDLEHPYITYENSYIESVWAILKHVSQQKDPQGRPMLYQGHKVVPYCTRCGTALSSHEVAQGYKNVTDTSVYVKFKIKNLKLKIPADKPVYILAWTTTPWTLPGNVALAVGKNIEYAIVESEDGTEQYIVAKDLAAKVLSHPDISSQPREEGSLSSSDSSSRLPARSQNDMIKGSDIIGLEYEPLFPGVIKDNGKAYRIYPADFVTIDEGTGVVHTAVMYGEDDYNLGTQVGLPTEHTVGEDGRFLPHVTEGLAGKYVKAAETETLIIESLRSRGLLLTELPYDHEYPHCWRCDTALLYYARDSWFIRMSELRAEMTKRNDTVHWEPGSIKEGRMGEWLANAKDWAISRERYWGTPLPFWQCDQGHLTVVESVAELEKLGGHVPDDLHRPFIDNVSFHCPICGHMTKRVLEVADVWLDSGSMPFAQVGYPHQPGSIAQFASHYPADYISEAIDQTRGWFYTLLAVATLMNQEAPYKNVICLGHVLDEHSKKMSKSKGNIVDPWAMLDKYGADALRFYFYSVNPAGEPKLFAEKDLQTVQRRVLMLYWNVYSFFITYANQMSWNKDQKTSNKKHVLDRWVLSRLNQVTGIMTGSLESYDVLTASRALQAFIDDVSTWYLRRSRSRFSEAADESDRTAAFQTLHYVLTTLAQLMAPFTPFMAEEIYRNLEKQSVHLSDWPKAGPVDDELLHDMADARAVASSGLEARMKSGVKVRQRLGKVIAHGKRTWDESGIAALIQDELNIQSLRLQFDQKSLKMNQSDNEQNEWVAAGEGKNAILLDVTITPELEQEGMLRELIRGVQDWRKNHGLTVSDRVEIQWTSEDPKIQSLMHNANLRHVLETNTRSEATEDLTLQPIEVLDLDLNGHPISLSITKL